MSIRRTSVDRLNEARKSSLPTIGKGKPLNSQGNEGDLTFRRTSDGLMLYIKANHSWHGVKVGESFSSLENTINDIKSRVDVMRQFRLPSTYSVTGNFILDASGDIELNADGGDVKIYDGTAKHFVFDCNNTRMRIFDDTTESDFLDITVGANGVTSITTVDNDGASGDLTLSPDGKIKLTALDGVADSIQCNVGSNTFASFQVEDGSYSQLRLYENGGESSNDYLEIKCEEHGATTISTLDASATAAHVIIDADGDIVLDSASGKFIAKNNGTEFSVANSAYAGMILGYTRLQHDGTNFASFEIQNSITVEDDTHKITFKTPPSENVEIKATFVVNRASTDTTITVGLSDADASTGYNSIGQLFEYDNIGLGISDDEVDDEVVTARWVLGASELAAVGSSNTFWIGIGTGGATKTAYLQYGFRATHNLCLHPFIIKASALPTTIYDGQ